MPRGDEGMHTGSRAVYDDATAAKRVITFANRHESGVDV